MKIVSPFFTSIRGRLGDAVGSQWRDVKYLRSWAMPHNPRTEKQIANRAKFKLASQWLKPIKSFLRVGWSLECKRCTECNAAMSYLMKNAVTGAYPDWRIDAGSVLVSRGSLTKLESPSVTVGTNGFSFTWTDNSGRCDANSDDEVMVLLYNLDKGEAICLTDIGVQRSAASYQYHAPSDWTGDEVAVWITVRREDGSSMADSQYLGSFNAA